jgi:hypothetical protein
MKGNVNKREKKTGIKDEQRERKRERKRWLKEE